MAASFEGIGGGWCVVGIFEGRLLLRVMAMVDFYVEDDNGVTASIYMSEQ